MKRSLIKFSVLFCSLSFFMSVGLVTAQTGSYTVQQGDTLWDITSRFFHDPWLWPNLWKNNPQISNPHLIFPGHRLLLSVEEQGPEGAAEKKGPVEGLVVPPPVTAIEAQPLEKPPKTFSYAGINKVGFISPEEIKPKGTIRSLPRHKVLLSPDDIVYLETEERNLLTQGSMWRIYRAPHPVSHPATRKQIGYYYLPLGKLEIIQGGNPATARIVYSDREISIGDQLLPLEEAPPDITLKESSAALTATIIKAEPPVTQVAQGNVVYLDKGRKDGLEAGNSLEVFGSKEVAGSQQYIIFGEILVLRTEEETSSGLVTKSKQSFSIGEKVRPGNY